MPSSETRLKSLQLTLSNDSSISLRSSAGHPPALQGCIHSGPSGNLLLERGSSSVVKIKCDDAAHGGSAFLTYFFGDFKKTLVLWLCMKPEAAAEIRFGIFDQNPRLDHGVLKKIAQEETKLEAVGFGKESHWEFQDNEEPTHKISIILNITSTDRQSEAQLNIREANNLSVNVPRPISVLNTVTTSLVEASEAGHVHENMAISSLIQAGVTGFASGTTYDGILGEGSTVAAPASWEFIRGVFWNDDPACDFFYDFEFSNGYFQQWDGPWASNFNTPGTITYRSHHGDLQFLHAMASDVGETPEETHRKIMLWLEVMYKLSVGDGIQETDQIDSTGLAEFFNDTTTPQGSQTLRDLLVGTTPKASDTDIKRRALGSCFHLIQDSYAVGHCQRELVNPGDMIDVEFTNYWQYSEWHPLKEKIYLKGFPEDNPGRFSSIKTFHSYNGQDDIRHSYYDAIPGVQELNPSDPASFYCIVGAHDALDVSTTLARAWMEGLPWEDNVSEVMKDAIKLASDATASDNMVDEHLWA